MGEGGECPKTGVLGTAAELGSWGLRMGPMQKRHLSQTCMTGRGKGAPGGAANAKALWVSPESGGGGGEQVE